MSHSSIPSPVNAPATRPGMVVLGIVFILVWTLAHFVLLGLSFAGGLILDLGLALLKTLALPGPVIDSPGMEMAWVTPMQIGITLTGAAGLPAGLAFFRRSRRKALLRTFAGLFAAGLAFDLYAIFRLFADALKGVQ